jgi:hypothetical protein
LKPSKDLPELLEAIRTNVVQAYKLLQTQNATDLSITMSELAMQNFSISYYVAEYEFESRSLEAEYKRQCAVTYMQQRESGQTEKNSDAQARLKWSDLQKEFLVASKSYRLAKSAHADVENLIDIIRSRLSLLKLEISQLKET